MSDETASSAGGLQAAIVAALRRPEAYPHAVDAVQHVQTHISHVFLAGAHVYKLKKAVVFPFLDFGTLPAREHFCREEVRLNRRLAPGVYVDVVPIVRANDSFVVGGTGQAVDWLVHMVRLPAERSLAMLARTRAVTLATMGALAERIARFHAEASLAGGGTPEALASIWVENLAGVRPYVGRHLAEEDFEVLADFGHTFLARHDAVLRARPQLGHVREGHGDLRADHVYVLDQPVSVPGAASLRPGLYVVDCIEFSEAFRSIDVAADVSFLVMELEQLDRRDLADTFLRAYAEAATDASVAALVPYYACHRATVRGKVEALASDEPEVGTEERA
ncbi:MAG: AAA family ATPase, partial [Candidatus Binatia bacterium]